RAQPMHQALKEFARQSGYQVFFQSELTRGRQAPAVIGKIAPEAALERLLANSGLSFRLVNARTVAIHEAPPAHARNQIQPVWLAQAQTTDSASSDPQSSAAS